MKEEKKNQKKHANSYESILQGTLISTHSDGNQYLQSAYCVSSPKL